MPIINSDNPQIMGDLVKFTANNQTYTAKSLRDLANDGSYPSQIKDKQGTVSIAATDLRSDNSRLILISNSKRIMRFKITTFGLSFLGSFYLDTQSQGGEEVFSNIPLSEMELVTLSNGNYHVS